VSEPASCRTLFLRCKIKTLQNAVIVLVAQGHATSGDFKQSANKQNNLLLLATLQ